MRSFIPMAVEVGDPITLTTLTGATVEGEVAEVVRDSDGNVLALAVRDDPSRPDPVWFRGDIIGFWRLGAGVRQVGTNNVVPVDPRMMQRLREGR
jgi:hypothetical protein